VNKFINKFAIEVSKVYNGADKLVGFGFMLGYLVVPFSFVGRKLKKKTLSIKCLVRKGMQIIYTEDC